MMIGRVLTVVAALFLPTAPASAGDPATPILPPAVCSGTPDQVCPSAPDQESAPSAPRLRPDAVEWGAVTLDSLRFLTVQHAARIVIRDHVREGLKGPFFKDYWRTLRQPPAGFWDGDPWFTNVVGHSLQGSTAYLIARVNGATRPQAFWWGVVYSTQFELGLLGESAIGNIATSPVDLVITPLAGFALGVVEEWLLERLPKRGERFWLLTRPLVLGHVIVRLTTGK